MINIRVFVLVLCCFVFPFVITFFSISDNTTPLTLHQATTEQTQAIDTQQATQVVSYLPQATMEDSSSSLDLNFSSFPFILSYFGLLALFIFSIRKWKFLEYSDQFSSKTKFSTYFDIEFLLSNVQKFLLILEIVRIMAFGGLIVIILTHRPFDQIFFLSYPLVFLLGILGKIIDQLKFRLTEIEANLNDLRNHLDNLEKG
ncbi:MAG: hypothetical protein D6732_10280 [Methanobacteriota archaeon]|nr:MAG: hypothetical protein D6732_10280 [Euryarchaeota archaeon]